MNGIQRGSFLPAIDLIKDRFEVVDLNSPTGESFRPSDPSRPVTQSIFVLFDDTPPYLKRPISVKISSPTFPCSIPPFSFAVTSAMLARSRTNPNFYQTTSA